MNDSRVDDAENAGDDSRTVDSLRGETIAVPESRQLDVLVDLIESRGGRVVRLPLVSILDAPDPVPVLQWLKLFLEEPPDHFIILTGEGLRRLSSFAERAGCLDAFIAALARVHKICRGPKPGRALKELGLKPDLLGAAPTTAGIIASLQALDLAGKRVAVQLYGEEPNLPLMEYLQSRRAVGLSVAPYVYASHTEETRVADFIRQLPFGGVTAMTFTSQPQFIRLLEVARKHALESQLYKGLARIKIVAVGPIVAEQLRAAGVIVEVMPETAFFMKPMVMALVRLLRDQKRSNSRTRD